MKRVRKIIVLLGDQVGRSELRFHLLRRLWPVLQCTARIYRKRVVRNVKIVAIIGSLGKTTTTNAVRCALGLRQNSDFTSNAWSSLALKMLKIKPSQKYEVIEVGIGSAGQMEKYARLIRPDVVVVTAIASEHTGLIGSIENIRHEKSKMLKILKRDNLVVFNGDDKEILLMLGETPARKISYGFDPRAKICCVASELNWPEGMRVQIRGENRMLKFQSKIFSEHMIYPLLASFAVAGELGLKSEKVVSRLEKFRSPSGRMDVIKLDNGAFLIRDDYKATFESIGPALAFLRKVPAKRKIVVLGDSIEMPKPWQSACRKIGEEIAAFASFVFFIGQMEKEYAAGARDAGMNPENIFLSGNNWKNAFRQLPPDLGPGDVVLVKALAFQRIQRFSLALLGQQIECDRDWCQVKSVRCENCAWRNKAGNTFYAQKTIVWEPA
jgi:UDP-N-acetylmuramoyl-tripeptide--D-alanyl-D-alanine ligase